MELPDTPAQKEAREAYDEACRKLASAAVRLKDAQQNYDRMHAEYLQALGRAIQAGVIPQ